MRANDLAAAAVARCRERTNLLRCRLEQRLSAAESRKRSIDANKLHRIRTHLARIAAACASRRSLLTMRLLVAEHETAATLSLCRPPPVVVPADVPAGEEDELASPLIIYTPKHDDTASEYEDDDEIDMADGYTPDEESGYLSRHLSPVPLPRGLGLASNMERATQEVCGRGQEVCGRGQEPRGRGLAVHIELATREMLIATRQARRVLAARTLTPMRPRAVHAGVKRTIEFDVYDLPHEEFEC